MVALFIWGIVIMCFAPAVGAAIIGVSIFASLLSAIGGAAVTLGAVPSDVSIPRRRSRNVARRDWQVGRRLRWLFKELGRVGLIITACAGVAIVLAVATVQLRSVL